MRGWSSLLGAFLLAGAGAGTGQHHGGAANYRDWVFLTSSLDLNYTPRPRRPSHAGQCLRQSRAHKVFCSTGTWPDKTILIKENRMAESAGTLSKAGHFQADVMNLEIHIKDEARFPGKWAFFVSQNGKAPAS
jgi:hypothetical protein